MNFNKIFLFGLAVLVASCASTKNNQQAELRNLIVQGQNKKALEFVTTENFLAEKNSELLKLIERGRVFFINKQYYQALHDFDKANELSGQLYTVSISKKALSAVSNDSADNYYGENYERSLIRFYQSLTHYSLYSAGKYEAYTISEKSKNGKEVKNIDVAEKILTTQEAKFHFTAAKSVLIEWDSYLTSVKATTSGVVTYKDDLLAKLYGAFIHEQAGSASDVQVAKDLYKAAKDMLFKNFDIYQTYNGKYKIFRDKFSDLSKMPVDQVEKNFVQKSNHYSGLIKFIDERLDALEKGKIDNVLFIVEDGLVQAKKAKKYDFPIIFGSSDNAHNAPVSGNLSLIDFTLKALEVSANTLPKIYFELPEIPLAEIPQEATLMIESVDGSFKKEVSLSVANPISEVANQALDEKMTGISVKTGTRVAAKHVAALGASYLIYTNQKAKIGEMLALSVATLSYAGLNKVIESSEQADLRSWQTLPANFRISRLSLPKGNYKINVKMAGQLQPLENVEVKDEKAPMLVMLKM
jgi:hypothetical protein